jgi:hypothetical protein
MKWMMYAGLIGTLTACAQDSDAATKEPAAIDIATVSIKAEFASHDDQGAQTLKTFSASLKKDSQTVCAIDTREGCYWMENTTGSYCWVYWEDTTIARCWQLDSCDGGASMSGGGCYKWADGAHSERTPWTEVLDDAMLEGLDDFGEEGC